MNEGSMVITVILGFVIMLVVAIMLIWYFNSSQKKITNVKIKQQELELSIQKQLLINTVKTQEKERDRIAKELHDDIASKLNIVHLNLHLLKSHTISSDESDTIIERIDSSLKTCS